MWVDPRFASSSYRETVAMLVAVNQALFDIEAASNMVVTTTRHIRNRIVEGKRARWRVIHGGRV